MVSYPFTIIVTLLWTTTLPVSYFAIAGNTELMRELMGKMMVPFETFVTNIGSLLTYTRSQIKDTHVISMNTLRNQLPDIKDHLLSDGEEG